MVFMFSLQDMEGDNKVVYIVDNWKEMEAYSGDVKNGYYQILNVDGEVEIRVQVGRLGFIKKFKDPLDPLLSEIIDFCTHKYFNVSKSIRDDFFFK